MAIRLQISGDEVRLTHWQHDRLQKVARVSLDFVGDNREKDAESTCSPKTWAQAILQISNRFVSSTEAAKCEDGDARLALWERRENRRRTRHSVCPVSRLSKASPRRSALTLVDDSRAFEKPSHDVIVHFFRTSGRAQHAGMRDDGEVHTLPLCIIDRTHLLRSASLRSFVSGFMAS